MTKDTLRVSVSGNVVLDVSVSTLKQVSEEAFERMMEVTA